MRYLVCIAGSEFDTIGPGFRLSPSREKFEVMEGVTGMTPFGLQLTHVTQETAESLVKKYPSGWQIIDARDLDELERMYEQ